MKAPHMVLIITLQGLTKSLLFLYEETQEQGASAWAKVTQLARGAAEPSCPDLSSGDIVISHPCNFLCSRSWMLAVLQALAGQPAFLGQCVLWLHRESHCYCRGPCILPGAQEASLPAALPRPGSQAPFRVGLMPSLMCAVSGTCTPSPSGPAMSCKGAESDK